MLKAFLAYYRPHRTLFLIDFGCAVLSGLLELGFPMAVKGFVDELLPRQDWTLILVAAAALAAIYVANAGLMVVVTYWGHVLGINIETEMRARAFDHLQKLSFRFYDNQKTGHLVARVTKDLEEIGEVAHHGPEDLFIAVMTLVGAFALMILVHPPLALLTAGIVPVIAFVSLRYGGRMTRNWQAQYGRVGAFNARIEENVGGIRVVKAFANEPHEKRLFASDNRKYRETKLEAYRIMATSLSINYLGMRLVQIVVLLGGAAFVVRGELSAGGFVGFLLLVGVFYRPLEKIGAVVETYPKGIAGFRRYSELMATAPDIVDRPGAVAVAALRGDIRFDDVCFGYTADRPVLSGLHLAIDAGETVAFVGPSGAGKTTLCSLVPRFYEVEAGRITIDATDIRDMTLASLRRQIGIVQQDVFLFAGTIRENIAYGRLDADEPAIVEAARRAKLDALIAGLPLGLDTVVGERGVKLSGGQKQRLAIARVFLKNPPILILDEATSALDSETERAIQDSLTELAQGRTTLVIAHRLATIRNADRIVVVSPDGIVEQGRHDALLAAGGTYQRLYEAQFAHRSDDQGGSVAAE
ncbi:ABC transporter ATP-binding protein/permease [Methylobacterium sp. E-041]|uniref:ABC transporter ATP-binding protein n=1 Tax=Methylobacterium sp. E-041 TaxID=2836573 RepID=UPI001FB88792|nr:ABC transporter ATP-binding protein [Methylobacterium sp. E-041]MCJ2108545.1 ABC transporter ATP-binding protein/permease [Methylobacterium sp. E-041]